MLDCLDSCVGLFFWGGEKIETRVQEKKKLAKKKKALKI